MTKADDNFPRHQGDSDPHASPARRYDSDPALQGYMDAYEKNPDDVDATYRAATALLRSGELEDASSLLRKIVFNYPEHTRARANLGNCQLLLNDLANAEISFRAVLEAQPTNHNALYGLATIQIRLGHFTEAAQTAHKLLGLLPDNAPVLTLYADALASDPQPGQAIAAYNAALKLDGTYHPALVGYAKLLTRRKRFEEALDLALRATNIGTGSPDAYEVLGDVYWHTQNIEEAEHAYLAALDRAPENAPLKVKLSHIARRRGDFGLALRYADDAYCEDPENRDTGNALGNTLVAFGERVAARALLTATAAHQPMPDKVRSVIERLRTAAISQPSLPEFPLSTGPSRELSTLNRFETATAYSWAHTKSFSFSR